MAATAPGSWTIYRWGWQLASSQQIDQAYVPFFGAFGAASSIRHVSLDNVPNAGVYRFGPVAEG
jgi:hypothetical protein